MIEIPMTKNAAYQVIKPENQASGILPCIAIAAMVAGEMSTR
jgi:hypothetical protein